MVESLSLKQTFNELNELGHRIQPKKQWDKTKLSSYIKHMKLDVGKG